MINFLLKIWTAIEIVMWLKQMREADDENGLRERREKDRVQPKDRSTRSSVLDDIPPKEKRH